MVLWHSPIVSFLLKLKLFCFQKSVKLIVLRVDVVLLHLVNKLGDGTAGSVPIEVEFLQDNFQVADIYSVASFLEDLLQFGRSQDFSKTNLHRLSCLNEGAFHVAYIVYHSINRTLIHLRQHTKCRSSFRPLRPTQSSHTRLLGPIRLKGSNIFSTIRTHGPIFHFLHNLQL